MSDTEQARSNEGDITEQIFDRFKTYLDQKVATLTTDLTSQSNHQSKHLERQSEGRQLKFEGNKDQFLFNAELQEHIEISSGLLKQADISGALEKLETAQRSIHNRQKKIKLADKGEAGWLAVKEYESEDLATLKMRNALKKPKPQPYVRSQSNAKRIFSNRNTKAILTLVWLAVAIINFFEVIYAYIAIDAQCLSSG